MPALSPTNLRASLTRVGLTIDYPVVQAHAAPTASLAAGATSTRARSAPSSTGNGGVAASRQGEKTPWRQVTLADLIAAGLVSPPFEIEATYQSRLGPEGHHRMATTPVADGRRHWQAVGWKPHHRSCAAGDKKSDGDSTAGMTNRYSATLLPPA